MPPHGYGILGRPDPFFTPTPPQSRSFLESLHRTYGEPPGALPKRDEAAFQRAIDFRQKEKSKYADIEAENTKLKSQVAHLETSRAQLAEETEKIKALWEKLSKAQKNDEVRAGTSAEPVEEHNKPRQRRSLRSGTGRGKSVVQPPVDRTHDSSSTHVSRDEQDGKREGAGEEDGVRREVLSAGSVSDPRGSPAEHAAEGSELRGRAEAPSTDGDTGDAVHEDKE